MSVEFCDVPGLRASLGMPNGQNLRAFGEDGVFASGSKERIRNPVRGLGIVIRTILPINGWDPISRDKAIDRFHVI